GLHHTRLSREAFGRAGSVRDVVSATGASADLLYELGAHDESAAQAREAMQHGDRLLEKSWMFYPKLVLGAIHTRLGEFDKAEPLLREAADGFGALNAQENTGLALAFLARCAAALDDLSEARRLGTRAVEISAHSPMAHAKAHATMAKVALMERRADEALES